MEFNLSNVSTKNWTLIKKTAKRKEYQVQVQE